MDRRFLALILFFPLHLCLALPVFSQERGPFPDSGHVGPVLSLAWDRESGYLFSSGQDGSLRVWQTSPLRLVRKLQISPLPLRKIDVSPLTKEVALLQSDGMGSHTLKVVNWETGKVGFSQNLPEIPLSLKFSSQGNFVALSKTDWKSLAFYGARDGRQLSYLREGFGIVSFFVLSDSENTILTYTPSSGNFTYWETKTGKQKELVRSSVELENLCPYNRRYVLATRSGELLAVDMVTGAAAAAVRASGIAKIVTGPEGRIITLSPAEGKTLLQSWMFIAPVGGSPGILSKTGEAVPLPPDISDAVLTHDSGYFALADGTIGSMPGGTNQLEREGLSQTIPVTDVLALEGVLYAITPEKIHIFSSDLFRQDIADLRRPSFFTSSLEDNPLHAAAGIVKGTQGDVFLYRKEDGKPGRIIRLDIENRKVLAQFTQFSLPLVSVQEREGYLFALEKNGALKKIDASTMRSVYEYPAWNIQSFAPVDKAIFWAGTNKTDQHGSPLVMINTQTGETVPVRTQGSLFLVYDIIHDIPRGKIYYLGLSQAAGKKTETRIFSANDPRKPESSPSFGTYAAADINSAIHIDTGQEFAVYATLGTTFIRRWSGSRWSDFEPNGCLVTAIRDYGKLLFGINNDGSVSAWEKRTGKLVGTFCILKDGSWIAADAEGMTFTGRGTGSP
ncbi:MAG: hypothetical protein LBT33_11280 [Spirochaetia bacterium]|jgi:WD40 repeat protein|nr:hypothetical protein [Spirochaetia bacterium]